MVVPGGAGFPPGTRSIDRSYPEKRLGYGYGSKKTAGRKHFVTNRQRRLRADARARLQPWSPSKG
jgi:hypothetical protein